MTWRVAKSLDVLLAEVNAAAPRRSKVSDGSIGDAKHAVRDSDHNPWIIVGGVGVVRARDFTHDPAGGFDCNVFADHVAAKLGVHPALKSGAYVIWNRRIWSADRRGEGWRPYSGENPHDKHCHVSVTTFSPQFDSTQRWGVAVTAAPAKPPAPKPTQRDLARAGLRKTIKTLGPGALKKRLQRFNQRLKR